MKFIKNILKYVTIVHIVIICLMSTAFAGQQIIEADGSYTIGDGLDENISVAKDRAKTNALRNASEQTSVLVESLSIVQEGMLTKDEIQVISANIMKLQGEPKFKVIPVSDDVIRYQCHVVVLVDTDNINEKLLQDKQALNEAVRRNQELTEEVERLNREMENLKQKYNTASTEKERQKIKEEVKKNDDDFAAVQWNEQGANLYWQGHYSEAIKAFSTAIDKNPQYAYAYNNRGVAYNKLHDYTKAISDLNQAITLDSNYTAAYVARGYCYGQMKKYTNAISDFNKAISLDSKSALAYSGRGFAYYNIENYEHAISDFNRSISLDSSDANSFYGRGLAYTNLQHYQEALRDFQKALAINPQLEAARENIDMIRKAM